MLVFPVKSSVLLYFDGKLRARQQLGNNPGVGKCPTPGQRKIGKCPTPGNDKAGKCPAVAGRGAWPSWRTDALVDHSLLRMPKIIEIG